MILTLMSSTDDERVLDKTTSTVATVTAEPTENVDILTPEMIIENNTAYLAANYCYIEEFSRYYYIKDITLMRGHRCKLSLYIDVLMTYSTAIRECSGVITRSESAGKPTQIPDDRLPIDPNRNELLSILFSRTPFNIDPMNAKCWQLTTIGGVLT